MAFEAKGQNASARSQYEKVLKTWPKTSGSKTSKRAEERLASLPRD
jgi:TolA-binding protein